MKRHKQYIWAAIAVVLFLIGGCQTKEIIDENETETGQLHFSPTLGGAETATRAAESDNGVLQTASAAKTSLSHIVINTYTGVPGTSLKEYFSDKLGYFDSRKCWDVTSENKRFLPTGGMNLYAYFATNCFKEADLAKVTYIHPTADTDHPKLTFTVAEAEASAFSQVDLVAAKVVGITSPNVSIPLRHILSQINFGVKGMDQHKIKVTNICINKVKGAGSFNYNTWQWTPNADTELLTYPYYFPDRKEGDSGLGDTYTTPGNPDDSQNSYLFGDGGKFGPGGEDTFLYAQVNPSPSNYATKANTPKDAPLNNSLMLLPQKIKENKEATVTFDYEVKLGDQTIRTATGNVVRLDAYYDWEPNMRYVYLFKFDNPEKVTFDVLLEPWVESPGNIETDELSSAYLFQKYVQPIKPSGNYSVPIGPLTEDFICDWSLFTLSNDFVKDNTFTLTFDDKHTFENGKSVIINPPFGFTASVASLSAPGMVTFTAIHSYYSTLNALNSAISSGIGNHEFSVNNTIKLNDIKFIGSKTAESSLVLHYPTSYIGMPPSNWQLLDSQTAVCYPNDYALTSTTPSYSYTIYTVGGLKAVFDWMNNGGTPPGGSTSTPDIAKRMETNINLATNGRYNLAEVYKANAADTKLAFVPIGVYNTSPYTGNFDGRGATVENLYINSADTNAQGFFGYNKGGTVQNLHLANASVFGATYIGGISGINEGIIFNCSVSGSVENTGDIVGGIAGSNLNTIIGCSSSATIYGGNPGGIAGSGGIITACYSTGNITGWGNVGGIAAKGGTTTACYSTSVLGGSGTLGGIVGDDSGGKTSSCYYVAAADIGTHPAGVTRLLSVANLNGKVPQLNEAVKSNNANAHFVSGYIDTSPTIAPGIPAERKRGGVLKGTFIQNWFALYWDQNRWNQEMALLATLGMEYLIIDQVMEFSGFEGNKQYMSWYPASQSVLENDPTFFINANEHALEYCMNACRAHDIKLFIGTFFDKRYWDDGAAVTNQALWNNCITTANNVMDELTKFYFNGGSSLKGDYTNVLAGWYFPYEVDDFNFQTKETQNILKAGISTAMAHRNKPSTPNTNKPYLFSPFMNGTGPDAIKETTMTASEYATLWSDIIRNTGFQAGDILSPQDCIGAGKLTIGDLKTWMPALKGATAAVPGVKFWINVETFGPGGNASFLTGTQIPASKNYADTLISFSYPIYYSPNSSDIYRQGDHKAYKAYYDAQ